jgi:hypothetical protein
MKKGDLWSQKSMHAQGRIGHEEGKGQGDGQPVLESTSEKNLR